MNGAAWKCLACALGKHALCDGAPCECAAAGRRHGWVSMMPGLYIDEHQTGHVYASEMLAYLGYEDTEDNRRVIEQAVMECLNEYYGEPVPVRYAERPGKGIQ